MRSVFPRGTFPAGAKPRFDQVCTQTDARKGGHSLHTQVVRASSGGSAPTDGMREWSLFGWYEMAAFAVARSACCGDSPPLATTLVPKACPLDQSLETLGTVAVGADDAALAAAVRGYRDVVDCLVRTAAAAAFGHRAAVDPRAVAAFDQYLARVRKAQGP
jgi:hypothetical protein